MSELFSKDNLVRIAVTLMAGAIVYLFNMVYDVRHTVHVTTEQQEQNKRQWVKIVDNSQDIAIVKECLRWLEKYGKK